MRVKTNPGKSRN